MGLWVQIDRSFRGRASDIHFSGACNRQRRIFDAVCCAAAAGSVPNLSAKGRWRSLQHSGRAVGYFLQCNSTTSEAWLRNCFFTYFCAHNWRVRRCSDDWGNVPGKTQVVSTEIYSYVEAMEYSKGPLAGWRYGLI